MKSRAFTLVEVTLVIAIGAILVAGTFWATKAYRDNTRVQAGKVDLSTLRLAAEGYRYRTGNRLPYGIASRLATPPGPSSLTIASASTEFAVQARDVLCVYPSAGSPMPLRITSVAGNVINFTGSTTGMAAGNPVRAGALGNVDDQCTDLVRTGFAGAEPISGMGLSDPWLGYTNVRPSTAANLPSYDTSKGFQYNPARPNDVWGGLVYLGNDLEYVLPDPTGTRPPTHLGYFPGDPPKNWGK
ncbi:MAG: type II secretion system protein [Candidatus Sericytochromatia bacterium]|nr:type II secretion system protein [Candidatus Tanganyikabacteria bacterium]